MTLITAQILQREDTEANWIAADPRLGAAEMAFSSDKFYGITNQQKFKVGNGVDKWTVLDYMPMSGSNLIASNITVSLSGGKTYGKYLNGQTVPSAGMTVEQLFRDLAIEDIAPVYAIPVITLTKSVSSNEVGTPYTNNLVATFTKNDAGALIAIRIKKNGTDLLPNGVTSPLNKTDSGSYVLGNITYIAEADYAAGVIKNYTPSNTPDARVPLVRNPNAPQAASTGFQSTPQIITGYYKYFYGDSASTPINSAAVRALPTSQLSSIGNTFTLNTGAINKIFTIAIPATKNLISVIDTSALNADITANFILSTFNVSDAAGNPVSYKVYTMTNASAYSPTHLLSITLS